MHTSPRPIRLLVGNDVRLRARWKPLRAFILYALLAVSGAILVSALGGPVAPCEDLVAACVGP